MFCNGESYNDALLWALFCERLVAVVFAFASCFVDALPDFEHTFDRYFLPLDG